MIEERREGAHLKREEAPTPRFKARYQRQKCHDSHGRGALLLQQAVGMDVSLVIDPVTDPSFSAHRGSNNIQWSQINGTMGISRRRNQQRPIIARLGITIMPMTYRPRKKKTLMATLDRHLAVPSRLTIQAFNPSANEDGHMPCIHPSLMGNHPWSYAFPALEDQRSSSSRTP